MGALLLYFVIGSIVSVPFLGYQLLRTRRELNELRTELRRRGLIAPGPDGPPDLTERGPPDRLAGATAAPQPIAPSEPHSLAAPPTALLKTSHSSPSFLRLR